MAQIRIEIPPTGNPKISVTGAPGATCLKETAELEAELGEVVDREHTSEFYQRTQTGQQQKLGNS